MGNIQFIFTYITKNLSKCDYYFEAGKIIGTLKTNIGYCVARDIIEADCNFDNKIQFYYYEF